MVLQVRIAINHISINEHFFHEYYSNGSPEPKNKTFLQKEIVQYPLG